MAKTKKVDGMPAQPKNQESDNKSKFAAPFSKTKTQEEAKKVLDALVAGFTAAYEEKVVTFKPAKATPKSKAAPEPTQEAAPAPAPTPETEEVRQIKESDKRAIKKLALQFHDYSEKSFAITGETKPIKEIMEKYKGRFNRYLSVGAGWIFAKRYEAQVRAALAL